MLSFGECTLALVFVLGEHANVPSFRFSFRGTIRQNHPSVAIPRAWYNSGGVRVRFRVRFPVLPFLAFLENGKENHEKTRIVCPYRTPKSLEKEGKKHSKNRNSLQGKKQGIPKKQGKEGQGSKRRKSQSSVDSRLRTQLTKQQPQALLRGNFFVRVRFGLSCTV